MIRRGLVVVGAILAAGVAVHYARMTWGSGGNGTYAGGARPARGHETCGRVADVYHDTRGRGQPTFVDLGHAYPDQDLTVLIWQRDLGRFDPPPQAWQGKTICVAGHVTFYKGRREIIARTPRQVRIKS